MLLPWMNLVEQQRHQHLRKQQSLAATAMVSHRSAPFAWRLLVHGRLEHPTLVITFSVLAVSKNGQRLTTLVQMTDRSLTSYLLEPIRTERLAD
jgi:hypothetical protein